MFSIKLKDLREERGISQRQLAKELNLSENAVGYWESKNLTPITATLIKLANYFNVSVDYLLDRSNKKNEQYDTTIQKLIAICDKLNERQKQKVLAYAQGIFDTMEENEGDLKRLYD